ncbi:MAG: hypothetical protein ACFB12_00145 [Leptolyngbyaceae cyanobacterium]
MNPSARPQCNQGIGEQPMYANFIQLADRIRLYQISYQLISLELA